MIQVLGQCRRLAQHVTESAAEEDVVSKHHGNAVVANEVLPNEEGLRQTLRLFLNGILQLQSELVSFTQKVFKPLDVIGRRNNEDFPDSGEHEHGQRIENHGLVVYGKQLFTGDQRQRIQPRAGPAG